MQPDYFSIQLPCVCCIHISVTVSLSAAALCFTFHELFLLLAKKICFCMITIPFNALKKEIKRVLSFSSLYYVNLLPSFIPSPPLFFSKHSFLITHNGFNQQMKEILSTNRKMLQVMLWLQISPAERTICEVSHQRSALTQTFILPLLVNPCWW